MNESPSIDYVEAKSNAIHYRYVGISFLAILGISLIYPGSGKSNIEFLFHDWGWYKLPVIFFLIVLPVIFIAISFDKSVKIRIDEQGIWTKKTGMMSWDTIWYFYSTAIPIRGGYDYQLTVKQKDTAADEGKEITVDLLNLDYDFNDIRAVVEHYAPKYNINDLGHEQE